MNFDHASYLFRLLDNEAKADVLVELDEEQRSDLLSAMTAEEIAEDLLLQVLLGQVLKVALAERGLRLNVELGLVAVDLDSVAEHASFLEDEE